jgi:hypothetical protein
MNKVWYIVGGAVVAGIVAFFVYFWWSPSLLEGSRIDRFSYGPQGVNLREFAVVPRARQPELVDRVIGLVNEAPLSDRRVEPTKGKLVMVLFRDDGVQYDLLQDGPGYVGVAEGNHAYIGTLKSPELAALLAEIARSGQSR